MNFRDKRSICEIQIERTFVAQIQNRTQRLKSGVG